MDVNFKVTCYICGIIRQMKQNYSQKTEKTKESKTMFKDNYNNCGKKGHTDADYWNKEENAGKRWRS